MESGIIVGRVGDGQDVGNPIAFAVAIDGATGEVSTAQYSAVVHGDPADHDEFGNPILLSDLVYVTLTVTDGDGDTARATSGSALTIAFEDDGPNAVVFNATADTLVLDETRPVGTEEDGDNDPAGLATVTASFADNFAAVTDFGSDGPGSVGYTLVLTGSNVASGLFALGIGGAAGASIVLNQAAPGADIIGTVGVTEYFRISVNSGTGVVTFSQTTNVWHSNTGSDDDTATLTLANANLLQVVQTVTDADGDKDSAAINLGTGVFQIEDDGPNAVVFNATADTLVLDETRPVGTEEDGDNDPAGLATVTASFADNFAAVTDFGSDGPGSVGYTLVLTGSNVASGLFALGIGGAAGASIVLNQAAPGADIIGTVGVTEYFRISVNSGTGVVTFSQTTNVWHSNTGSDDDTATLTLANANLLQVVQTVTDADGDKDSAAINLGTGVFQIEDDGPNAVVFNATADTLVLDETRPVGTEEDGDNDPAGLATVTASFADNFAAVTDFGSDGPGSVGYTLVLTGSNVASGLFALGIGGAAGASIVLNQAAPGADIIGTVGVTEYFRISVNSGTGVVTFSQTTNVWHSNTGSDDDTATLTLANANLLQVVQTVTDADGDKDSAAINLGTSVFQIEDDGPNAVDFTRSGQADVGTNTNLMLILDTSGSMAGAGIEALKNSTLELLEQYDALGNIAVRIVTFSGTANESGAVWTDVATAKASVLALGTGGNTNFDAALLTAMGAFTDAGKIVGAQNALYFISDGNPTANQDWPGSS